MNYANGVKKRFRKERLVQWIQFVHENSKIVQEHCRSQVPGVLRYHPRRKEFPTGSAYDGTWNILGMETPYSGGSAKYTLPNGVIYEGEIKNGEFDGKGTLIYPDTTVLHAIWSEGRIVERLLVFSDGCAYAEEDWSYCTMPDRRFTIEYQIGLQPAGASILTARQPPPPLPRGCYDTVDGYFDPQVRMVFDYDRPNHIIRAPGKLEQQWIVTHCRQNWEKACGPLSALYEEWTKPDEDWEQSSDSTASSLDKYICSCNMEPCCHTASQPNKLVNVKSRSLAAIFRNFTSMLSPVDPIERVDVRKISF